ncbi:AMP-binding protein [Morganella morganii]|uniref:AMP-binding protein n=1 Tax=Morganella morganii TaxID=582 RepID=UPI0030FE714B
MSLDQPPERWYTICRNAGVRLVLVCRDDAASVAADSITLLAWQDTAGHTPLAEPVTAGARDPAYIIYTSGSTGQPKGVIISHRGALNTCAELNRRYAVTANDRMLALSALHFDLSVYDIFGLLSAGGALVLVNEDQLRDPASWCRMIEQHSVTLWNTVPALLDMLLTYSEGFRLQAPARLRAVMISGDWIGPDLPDRYRAFRADGQFIAMGGATEASIWSNVFDAGTIPPLWRSIPYGYPLARQKYRVAGADGRDCPDRVPANCGLAAKVSHRAILMTPNAPHNSSLSTMANAGIAPATWAVTGRMAAWNFWAGATSRSRWGAIASSWVRSRQHC